MARCNLCGRPIPNPFEVGEGCRVTSSGEWVCTRQSCFVRYSIREARNTLDLPTRPSREKRAMNDEQQQELHQ